jgi:hypothetical protein
MKPIHKLYKIYNLYIVLIEILTIIVIISISSHEINNVNDCNTNECIDYSNLVNIFNSTELIGQCQDLGNNLPTVCKKYANQYCSSRTYRCPYKEHGETLTDKHKCDSKKCVDCIGCWRGGTYYDCCDCREYEHTYDGFSCYISNLTIVILIIWIIISILWCLIYIVQLFILSLDDIINKQHKHFSPIMFFFLESIPFMIHTSTFICLYFLTLDFYGNMFNGIMKLLIGLIAVLNGSTMITNISISIIL